MKSKDANPSSRQILQRSSCSRLRTKKSQRFVSTFAAIVCSIIFFVMMTCTNPDTPPTTEAPHLSSRSGARGRQPLHHVYHHRQLPTWPLSRLALAILKNNDDGPEEATTPRVQDIDDDGRCQPSHQHLPHPPLLNPPQIVPGLETAPLKQSFSTQLSVSSITDLTPIGARSGNHKKNDDGRVETTAASVSVFRQPALRLSTTSKGRSTQEISKPIKTS